MTDTTTRNRRRHTHWFATAAFCTIALCAMTADLPNEDKLVDQKREVKWAVSGVSVALTLSALSVFAFILLKDKFIGTVMEGGLAFLTCGFLAAVLPTIMDWDNALAFARSYYSGPQFTRGLGYITNPNLYFFSWGAFLMSFWVLLSYMKHHAPAVVADNLRDMEGQNTLMKWFTLMATSFVVMVSASRLFESEACKNDDSDDGLWDDMCDRTKFGVSLGTISAILSLLWALVRGFSFANGRMGKMVDTLLTWLLFVMWIFGIIYLTFNYSKAPGIEMGNLYFFTWASFVVCVFMAMTSLQSWMGGGEDQEEQAAGEETKDEPKPDEKEETGVKQDEETA